VTYTPPQTPIPNVYFGMHINSPLQSAWPTVPFAVWRMWDTHTTWHDLEPTRGKWNFEVLDKLVALAESHHVEILMQLALSPDWVSARPTEKSADKPGNAAEPTDLRDWRDYVRMVSTRYKGRIHDYEIWNEPNLQQYWTGNVETLVTLTREAQQVPKSVDPSIVVVSPSATSSGGPIWLDKFLQAGGGNYVDVIGYHFYVHLAPPEQMGQLISQVESVLARHNIQKPIWCTEAGWEIPKPFPPDLAPGYVSRAYILTWAAGVSRFYWYAWDNKNWVTLQLTDPNSGAPTPAATAYATTEKWLLGATMSSCSSDNSGVWTCALTRNGSPSWIVWKESGQANYTIPASWTVHQSESVLGSEGSVHSGQQLSIGPLPQLLR
jgi:hypothetical protein